MFHALISMGVNSFITLAEADPRKIEIVTGRKYPFGNHIKEVVSSLPFKVDIKIEEIECQGHRNPKVVVTLTRLSESPRSTTKRHYAAMVVALEEENIILFHEKISIDEFSSPYSATILVSNPKQAKVTVKADLIFEELNLHKEYVFRNENTIHKHGIKQSSPLPNFNSLVYDFYQANNKNTSRPQIKESRRPNKSKVEISCMPTFELIDYDDQGKEEVVKGGGSINEFEDADCKIITARTIFDYIREFPVVPKLKGVEVTNKCKGPPPLPKGEKEVFELIRRKSKEFSAVKLLATDKILLDSNNGKRAWFDMEEEDGPTWKSNLLSRPIIRSPSAPFDNLVIKKKIEWFTNTTTTSSSSSRTESQI